MRTNFKIPHTFTIVFSIIVTCAVLTWIIPGGEFDRQVVNVDGHERSIVVDDSYHHVDRQPQTWQIFTSFFKGFERTAPIIVFILMIGGGSDDPDVFNEKMFDFQHITLAPILVLAGFVVEIVAIFWKRK